MHTSSHTAPAGVITRVHFDGSDSEAFGEHGEGWFDFDRDGQMWQYEAEFRVDEHMGLNTGIVEEARHYAREH